MMSTDEELIRLRSEAKTLRIRNASLERSNHSLKSQIKELELLVHEKDIRIKELENQIKDLNNRFTELKNQLDKFKGMIFKANIKLSQPNQQDEDQLKKSVGGQAGHPGSSRQVPERINQIKRAFYQCCPTCQNPLERAKLTTSHTVEDIPDLETVKTIVTEYQLERQWCPFCKKEVSPKPTEVIPYSRLGINLIIQALFWHYSCRLPYEVMTTMFAKTYNIKIEKGTIAEIFQRAKDHLGPAYNELLKVVRASPTKHADETSWRIDGQNAWLWAFLTKDTAFYTIEETRGKGVPEKTLAGSSPEDCLVHDDYAAYSKLPVNHQSCWAHLLRVSRESLNQAKNSQEMKALHLKLKTIFQKLNQITQEPFNLKERELEHKTIWQELQTIIKTKYQTSDTKKVQTRIKNQGKNLITAILHQDVPLTNNLAERAIRPLVVKRKISGGSRSNDGAAATAVNMSVIQTIKMRDLPLFSTLKSMILQGAIGEN